MRIWDINPNVLCRQHLLGEHREIHAIWSIITENKKGYSNHPETKRWKGKLKALYNRHEEIVKEMKKRGYVHNNPLEKRLAIGKDKQNVYIDTIEDQMKVLNNKNCNCRF
jgi:hypothetical protein